MTILNNTCNIVEICVMYPDLSYLFHDLFGTDLDNWLSIFKTFGLFLALALTSAGYVLKLELQRREKEGSLKPLSIIEEHKTGIDWGSIAYNSFIGFVLAMKLPYIFSHFTEFQSDPAAVLFSSKGNMGFGFIGAIALGAYLYYLESKKEVKPGKTERLLFPSQKAADITIVAGISGVVGAKLFSVLENLENFFNDPAGTLFSGSGLTIYGGLILGTIVVYRYIRKLGIPGGQMLDIGGMAILVGYGVGRMGCQFSGDGDWGIIAAAQPEWWFLPDWLWAYSYPNNVANSGELMEACDPAKYQEYLSARTMSIEQRCEAACGMRYCHEMVKAPVYPTPIYEIIISGLLFLGLWMLRKRVQIVGMLFCFYLIVQGIERFWIETIRVNEKYSFLGFEWSQAQYISVGITLAGIIGSFVLWNRHQKSLKEVQA
jgi:phosphatidylglycerol:prolipoprotein diacylglycerol transferase